MGIWDVAPMSEEQRQYAVARQFIERHPEYNPTPANSKMLLDWMEMRDMEMTLEGLELAYKIVFQGEPEPKLHLPVSTGLTGATTVNTSDLQDAPFTWADVLANQVINMAAEWEPLEDTIIEKKSEKPVAAMPSAWYSDVVEIQTTRRIKDND